MSVLGATALAAGISATASALNNWYNSRQVKKTNQYNEALMRESWNREDNAVQRRVADLKAAGLSPTLAAGDAAQTSGPISAQAHKSDFNIDALQALQLAQSIKESDANIAAKGASILQTKAMTDYYQSLTQGQINQNMTFEERWSLDKAKEQAQTFLFQQQGRIAEIEGDYKSKYIMAQIDNLTSQTKLNNANFYFTQTQEEKLRGELSWQDELNRSLVESRDSGTRKTNQEIQNLRKSYEKTSAEISHILSQNLNLSAQTQKIIEETVYQKLLYNSKLYDLQYSYALGLRTTDSGSGAMKIFNQIAGMVGSTADYYIGGIPHFGDFRY